MLIYRDQSCGGAPRELLLGLVRRARALGSDDTDLTSQLRRLLIDVGGVESAIVDALSPERDAWGATEQALRRSTMIAARCFRDAREGRDLALRDHPDDSRRQGSSSLAMELRALSDLPLPAAVKLKPAEGFSQYGLFPEQYLAAARRFASEARPRRVLVIGLRTIGCALSAVVAATLESTGSLVETLTLRPRGDAGDRRIVMSAELVGALRSRLRADRSVYVLIVDEGPGMSGSSLTGAARAMSTLGVPDARIVFFPSWSSDGAALSSPSARAAWPRHAQVSAEFEAAWILPSERGAALVDWSAGEWRRTLFSRSSEHPAVQPQHERRKLLVSGAKRCATDGNDVRIVLKFLGLDDTGEARAERARRLARVGLGPPVLGFSDGFLQMPLLPGRPLRAADADAALLDFLARYFSFIRVDRRVEGPPSLTPLLEMMQRNISLALDDEHALDRLGERGRACGAASAGWQPGRAPVGERAIITDARLAPHELLRLGDRFIKTDGTDHGDDHFFPGPCDIAWDLAGAFVELRLDAAQRRHLLAAFVSLSGDRDIERRLPFHLLAYRAFRVGYATVAERVLGGSPDGARFGRQRALHTRALRAAMRRV